MAEFYPRLKSMLIRQEGSVPHLYLDTVGKITVGVGFMLPDLDSALRINFHRGNSFAVATEIRRDYETVSQQSPGMLASYYKKFTECTLPNDEIDRLLDDKISEFEAGLGRNFDYFNYPEPARLGLFDMAYNLGIAGLMKKFPKFRFAVASRDWQTAAKESHRPQLSDDRNREVRELFESAA